MADVECLRRTIANLEKQLDQASQDYTSLATWCASLLSEYDRSNLPSGKGHRLVGPRMARLLECVREDMNRIEKGHGEEDDRPRQGDEDDGVAIDYERLLSSIEDIERRIGPARLPESIRNDIAALTSTHRAWIKNREYRRKKEDACAKRREAASHGLQT